jgi:hypothetical protein
LAEGRRSSPRPLPGPGGWCEPISAPRERLWRKIAVSSIDRSRPTKLFIT